MKAMKWMPLPTQGSKQHLLTLFLEVNEQTNIYLDFYVKLTGVYFIVCEGGSE